MIEIKCKPLSVNQAWQGKRYKTPAYKCYEKEIYHLLPQLKLPEAGPLKLYLEFGFSSSASDWDNPIKPFQDILQFKYAFNDSRIFEAHVKKVKVKKGGEYIRFDISQLNSMTCFKCLNQYRGDTCKNCYG